MQYSDYTIQDFALDDNFKNWVINPDEETNGFWTEWLNENPHRFDDIQKARQLVLTIQFEDQFLTEKEVNDLWDSIESAVDEKETTLKQTKQRFLFHDHNIPKKKPGKNKLFLVASIVVAISSLLAINLYPEEENNTRYAISSDYGETKTVRLKDGSLVTLNANSTITYQDNWGDDKVRKVWLKGEAYFEIEHKDNNQKFVVEANGNEINVLGTKFNVYARERNTNVLLTEGKVEFKSKNQERLQMVPGDLVSFNGKNQTLKIEAIELKDFTFWKEGNLVFRSKSLSEVSDLLKNNYDIDVFFLDGALADRKFTGVIPSENVEVLIESLAKAFDLSIERKKNVLIIKRKEQL